jgi:hypothetical protein
MQGDAINDVGSLSFTGPNNTSVDGFWVQSGAAISKGDGSKTSVAEFYSNDTDDSVIIRNVAPGVDDADAVNMAQLSEKISIPIGEVKVGQTIVVTAVDAEGKPTQWAAADFPEGGGETLTAEETRLAAGTYPTGTPGNTRLSTGLTVGDLKRWKLFVFRWACSSNTSLNNTYLTIGNTGKHIFQFNNAGLEVFAEWVDTARTVLGFYSGTAPSGGNAWGKISTTIPVLGAQIIDPNSGDSISSRAMQVMGAELDDVEIMIYSLNESKADYIWDIWGVIK